MNSLLQTLAVMSELKSYQKLDFHSGPYVTVSKVGMLSCIKRILFGTNRDMTFSFLETTYVQANEICTLLLESSRLIDRTEAGGGDSVIHQLKVLRGYLQKSITGINALKQTYGSDETATARLNVITLRAEEVIGKIEALLEND
jgi:hypothetical protein